MKLRQWLPAALLLSHMKASWGDSDYSAEDLDTSLSMKRQLFASSEQMQRLLEARSRFPDGIGYHRVSNENRTWNEAWEICHKDGGHLVEVNSKDEAVVLAGLTEKWPKEKWFHVGFHDLFKEGYHMGLFGLTLEKTGYDTWAPAQPNNHGGKEDCGSITRTGLLNDMDCGKRRPYICEFYP